MGYVTSNAIHVQEVEGGSVRDFQKKAANGRSLDKM